MALPRSPVGMIQKVTDIVEELEEKLEDVALPPS